jgi:hypothetical protein
MYIPYSFSRLLLAICAVALTLAAVPLHAERQVEKDKLPPQGAAAKDGGLSVEHFEGGKAVPVSRPKVEQEPGKPPTIVYPQSRRSTAFVETRDGTSVAVDEGVEWQGKVAYLSLTFELVVVDAKTKKAVWSANIGGFWDTITFEDRAKAGGPPHWVLVLRSSRRPEFAQDYDLETGKEGELRGGASKPAGRPLAVRKSWSGSAGVRDERTYCLIGNAQEWTKLRAELFGAEPTDIPTAGDVDFTKEMLLVCYAGKAHNWKGTSIELAVEDESRMHLRLNRATYQSIGGVGEEHPYGLFILPRRESTPVVLEYNRQNLIGGPPFWKEFTRIELKK